MSILTGIKIIEIQGIGPGPFCGMHLADLGADVVVIERPGLPAFGDIGDATITKRGKHVLKMNLKDENDQARLLELIEHADGLIEGMRPGVRLDELWVCSSDMTYAGIVLALKHMNSSIKPVCVSSLETPLQAGKTFEQAFVDVGNECAEHLGIETRLTEDDVTVHTNYVYPGYGKVSEGGLEAITLAGKHDGVLLDPVYTSKALGGLIDHIRKSLISADKKIVFIHTGGLPALFAYADQYDLNYNR